MVSRKRRSGTEQWAGSEPGAQPKRSLVVKPWSELVLVALSAISVLIGDLPYGPRPAH